MQVVLAVPVFGLVAGSALGLRWPALPAWCLAAAAAGFLLLAVHGQRVRQPVLIAACVFGISTVGGTLLAARAWQRAWRPALRVLFEAVAHDARIAATRTGRPLPEDDSASLIVSGVLQADASATVSGAVSLAVDVESAGRIGVSNGRSDPAANPASGGVLLSVAGALAPGAMREWRAGRRIRAPAELRRVARYLDPGVPDQERALARRGITLVGTVKSGALVEVVSAGSWPSEAAARVRAFTRRAIQDAVGPWGEQAAAIVTAIVIGDRTGLEPAVERRLQEAGTYHVIAISGGNIAILAGLTLAMFRFAGLLGRAAMLSAAAGLVAYGFVVGGGASVNRAVLMAVVYFVGRGWDLRGPPFQPLVLACGVLTLVDPLSVADPASLLTFGATAAIIAVAPIVRPGALRWPLSDGVSLLAASAAAEAALLPVAATVFGRITFAGLVLNFGAIPLMALAQLAGMALVPLTLLSSSAARMLGWLAWVGAEGLVRTAGLVALAPWSTWRVAAPAALATVAYYLALTGAWRLWRARADPQARESPAHRLWRMSLTGIALSAGLWIIVEPGRLWATNADGRLRVTFIDVGQGDSALIAFPGGGTLLIDTGGLAGAASFDIGDRVVGPVLRHFGVRRLGTLALTHGDADHIGGASSLIGEFRPWDVWDGVPVPRLEPLQRLRADAAAAAIRWTTLQRADAFAQGDVRLVVRHPPIPDWERQDVRNNDSIVLEVRWRDVSFVFTGDIEREAEAEVAPLFEPAPLRVLKVPHHGSNTSSSEPLLRALSPDVAVISVGRSNSFGHPSPVVLRRYEAHGAALFRTDQDGAVTVTTDGSTLDVETFTGRQLRVSQGMKTPVRSTAVSTRGTD